MGSWTDGCTDTPYFGFNTKQHGAAFTKVLECFAQATTREADCESSGFSNNGDCQAGECQLGGMCVCVPGWYQTRGGCNLCQPGYTHSTAYNDCIEDGSSCTNHNCVESLCASGCSNEYKGDGSAYDPP